jgi:Flp pilus assembly protein TadG
MRFWRDRRGNVAVMFALAVVPVIGAMGAALDYSVANSYRSDMQKALDSAALAVSKVMPMEQEELDKVATQYFNASLGHHSLTNVKVSVVPEQGHAKLHASGYYEPAVASLFGIDKFEVGVTSEARWGIGKVEVAMVLDQSLSMDSSGRIGALRTAAVQFLSVIKASAKNPGDAKVGIVPFDGMVNTGYTYNTRPSWVRFDWWDDNYGSCDRGNADNRDDCVAQYYCSKNASQNNTKNKCQNNNGTWKQAQWTSESRSNWKGCVYDRNKDYDVDDTAPTNNATYYPAAKCHSNPGVQAMTALTDNWATLESRAKALDPTGYTNITIGLAWGFHMLSDTGVYTQGSAYGTKDLTKYVILMTDGFNTKNRWKEDDACPTEGPECPDMDPRTTLACDKIKAAGIQIYAVRLIKGNESLLKGCASSAGMYYDVQSTAALAGAFKNIASQIAQLHLSK